MSQNTQLVCVTSFSHELFVASGSSLLHSFLDVGQEGIFYVGYEGPWNNLDSKKIFGFDLDCDAFLQDWLVANRDVIPDYLGGLAEECSCPGREERHAKHAYRCHWQWMNRNASRWFRKVASLLLVAATSARYVLWLDSDAYFRKAIPIDVFISWLGGKGMFYCRGHRPGVEAGVMGFDLGRGGRIFLDTMHERYVSRAYLSDERWDDGYQIGRVLDLGFKDARDLVHPTQWKHVTNDVIPKTVLNEYLAHRKGLHGRMLNLMK